jgi:hypothetical protein
MGKKVYLREREIDKQLSVYMDFVKKFFWDPIIDIKNEHPDAIPPELVKLFSKHQYETTHKKRQQIIDTFLYNLEIKGQPMQKQTNPQLILI